MSKECKFCKETKELSFFHKHKGMKDGHLNKCSSCVVKAVAKWRLQNPTARKEENIRVRNKNNSMTFFEYMKKRTANAIGRKASSIKYAHKRRRHLEGFVMSELDTFVFEEAARLCELRYKKLGTRWHVDHIIPLSHKTASGLHVASNFQVVPALWNVVKGNRNMNSFWNIT